MKKFLKFCKKFFRNFWVQLLFLLGCTVGIFALGGAFASEKSAWEIFVETVTSTDVLSIFLVAAVSLIVAKVVIRADRALEESLKIEDDHHKIISKYSGHARKTADYAGNVFLGEGEFMYLDRVPAKRRRPKNMIADSYSDAFRRREEEIEEYMDGGRLYLSGICLYANVAGGTRVRFDDRETTAELPTFIRENALSLLEAHGTSSVHNSLTVRLRGLDYKDGTLTLHTERSQYFYMLVTNRCMDYKLGSGLTVREVYEYDAKVSPLPGSKLGNQIGINGLVLTKDGYLLVEKRGKRKATWKDKFAQPISLAMKASDLGLREGTLGAEPEDADTAFRKIILKTIRKNYGLTEQDILPFSLSNNFLGVARDLLEGGKPNLYFYVIADMDAEELREYLEKKAKQAAKRRGKDLPSITKEKLDSEFYLVDHRKIAIDFGYRLKLKAADMLRIKREYAPRVNRLRELFDGAAHALRRACGLSVRKECGEALLASLYFADLCGERLQREAHTYGEDRT